MKRSTTGLIIAFLFLLPFSLSAHTGWGHLHGFEAGFLHPLSGMDHILAMFSIGFWAVSLDRKGKWIIPFVFLTVMSAGSLLPGIIAISSHMVEAVVLVSVILFGILIAISQRFRLPISMVFAAFFALFHGYSHGTEMQIAIGALESIAGFLFSTAALLFTGLASALLLRHYRQFTAIRLTGGAVILAGLYMTVF
jgi:urease accessory protein